MSKMRVDRQTVEALRIAAQMIVGLGLLQDGDIEMELMLANRFEHSVSNYLLVFGCMKLIEQVDVSKC